MSTTVITYQFAHAQGQITLCDRHARAATGLGPVSWGRRKGECDLCEATARAQQFEDDDARQALRLERRGRDG